MLTGYNTEIEHEGRVFHVQTEDKGKDNPIIETLIYVGGEIMAARRLSYADRTGDGLTDQALSEMIERQHQLVVRDIRLGKYDPPDVRRPFGDGVISSRSLDELIRDLIEGAAADGNLPDPPPRRRSGA